MMSNLKIIILSSFFLCAYVSKAQSHYEFYKPVDTINSILNKNPKVYYVEKGEIIKNIKQIQANRNGRIIIMDAIYTEIDSSEITVIPPKKVFIDLFKFDTIVVSGSRIYFNNKHKETYRTINGLNNKDILVFKRQIEKLKIACREYKSIHYIKEYYANLKTGYNTPGGFFKVTDNYKVTLLNNVLTISFDTFRFKEFQKTETVSFDLNEITNAYYKGTVYQEFDNSFSYYAVASSIGFKSKTKDYYLDVKLDSEIKYEESEIFKAFQILIESFK